MTNTIRLLTALLTCLFPFSIIGQQTDVPKFICSELQFIWESENSLEIPESVYYDSENQCLYVSNIKGTPTGQDGNGYLSKLNLQGEIVSHKWVTGLDAPKGIAKYGNYLFVSDINDLVVINIAKGEIEQKFAAPAAIFLNDVALNPKTGTVYVSDMMQDCIYRLKNGKFELWLKDTQLDHVNGLVYKDNFLYAGVTDKILKIDPANQVINTSVDKTGSIDGLLSIDENKWITSDWVGNIQLIESGKVKKILSTAEQQINAADLGYIPEQKIILVPTFHNNRVVAYQFK